MTWPYGANAAGVSWAGLVMVVLELEEGLGAGGRVELEE